MVSKFKGEVNLSDIRLVYEDLPALSKNEVLLEGIYWSVDPYMRQSMNDFQEGSMMIGGQVAK
jgi:NADPH-dependent curcumin reductase CurA